MFKSLNPQRIKKVLMDASDSKGEVKREILLYSSRDLLLKAAFLKQEV